ncbi:MAG: GNAT family N-acetyltransferase [Pseudomonadota bacterium]
MQTRAWRPGDNNALEELLQQQCAEDLRWPPQYARQQNLLDWLSAPADLHRWICHKNNQVVGHIGLGTPGVNPLELYHAAIDQPEARFAELCRTVVHPHYRKAGVAAQLTRVAIKAALNDKCIPVATVLTSRRGWLQQMLTSGWVEVGRLPAIAADECLVCLLPPAKFIDAVSSK